MIIFSDILFSAVREILFDNNESTDLGWLPDFAAYAVLEQLCCLRSLTLLFSALPLDPAGGLFYQNALIN